VRSRSRLRVPDDEGLYYFFKGLHFGDEALHHLSRPLKVKRQKIEGHRSKETLTSDDLDDNLKVKGHFDLDGDLTGESGISLDNSYDSGEDLSFPLEKNTPEKLFTRGLRLSFLDEVHSNCFHNKFLFTFATSDKNLMKSFLSSFGNSGNPEAHGEGDPKGVGRRPQAACPAGGHPCNSHKAVSGLAFPKA
jgi:hypothetical protein